MFMLIIVGILTMGGSNKPVTVTIRGLLAAECRDFAEKARTADVQTNMGPMRVTSAVCRRVR